MNAKLQLIDVLDVTHVPVSAGPNVSGETSVVVSSGTNPIDVQRKLNQRSVQNHLMSIDWHTSSSAPFVVEFDPTTACNLACPDCISGSLLNQGQIERQRIKSLTQEMVDAGVQAVILIGGGEPMMHADIGWVINTLGEAGVRIGITTNGLYLKKHLEVTSRYADWVRVSMDAGTSETFNRLRPSRTGKSMFNMAIDNMRAYAQAKRGRLGYSFMVFSEGSYGFQEFTTLAEKPEIRAIKTNVHEIYQAAVLAKSIGCDYFEVKPMYDVNHFSVMQRAEIAQEVYDQLDRCRALNDDQFSVIEAVKLRETLSGGIGLEPKSYRRCAVAQLRTLVTPSGVYVCPYFRGVESKKIGDISQTSFRDMWHGDQRAKVMDRLDPSRDCRMHCIRHQSNLTIEQQLEHGFPSPTDDYDLFI